MRTNLDIYVLIIIVIYFSTWLKLTKYALLKIEPDTLTISERIDVVVFLMFVLFYFHDCVFLTSGVQVSAFWFYILTFCHLGRFPDNDDNLFAPLIHISDID